MDLEDGSVVELLKLEQGVCFGQIQPIRPAFTLIKGSFAVADRIVDEELEDGPNCVEEHVVRNNITNVLEPVWVEVSVDSPEKQLEDGGLSAFEAGKKGQEGSLKERRNKHAFNNERSFIRIVSEPDTSCDTHEN